jgi:hypothetical protein
MEEATYDAEYRQEQFREAAICLLLLGGVAGTTTAGYFCAVSQSNLGLLAYPTYALPFLVAAQGAWAAFVALAGAYTLMYKKYMSEAKRGCCAEAPTAVLKRACCDPFAKPNVDTVHFYTMPLRWVVYNLYLVCAMAAVVVVACGAAPARAGEELRWRWDELFHSQEGSAILLQNQDEYECCGYTDDTDSAAQPCAMMESGDRSVGCGDKLVLAFGGMMQGLCAGQFALLVVLLIALYFVRRELARVDEDVLKKYGRRWNKTARNGGGGGGNSV